MGEQIKRLRWDNPVIKNTATIIKYNTKILCAQYTKILKHYTQ